MVKEKQLYRIGRHDGQSDPFTLERENCRRYGIRHCPDSCTFKLRRGTKNQVHASCFRFVNLRERHIVYIAVALFNWKQ
jgi:hypothetical protein